MTSRPDPHATGNRGVPVGDHGRELLMHRGLPLLAERGIRCHWIKLMMVAFLGEVDIAVNDRMGLTGAQFGLHRSIASLLLII
jgi:hypothetical protein